MKILLWIVFISLVLLMGFQAHVLKYATRQQYTIVRLEKAGKAEGQTILKAWNGLPYRNGTMLELAVRNTHWDFLFIFCYVSLLLLHSNDRMQKEKALWLNTLLRLNLPQAILAGLLDIAENTILLHNFRHVADGRYYLETLFVTAPKFAFAGWALLFFLVSLAKSQLRSWLPAERPNSPVTA